MLSFPNTWAPSMSHSQALMLSVSMKFTFQLTVSSKDKPPAQWRQQSGYKLRGLFHTWAVHRKGPPPALNTDASN